MNRVDESSVEQRLWDFNFSREDKWLKKKSRLLGLTSTKPSCRESLDVFITRCFALIVVF